MFPHLQFVVRKQNCLVVVATPDRNVNFRISSPSSNGPDKRLHAMLSDGMGIVPMKKQTEQLSKSQGNRRHIFPPGQNARAQCLCCRLAGCVSSIPPPQGLVISWQPELILPKILSLCSVRHGSQMRRSSSNLHCMFGTRNATGHTGIRLCSPIYSYLRVHIKRSGVCKSKIWYCS